MSKKFFVFDVESIGLHGEGFVVGWTVVDETGKELAFGLLHSDSWGAVGTNEDREWVIRNVPELDEVPEVIRCNNPKHVRDYFWSEWNKWRTEDAIMAADCLWPVEARFLNACIDDAQDAPGEYNHRREQGPYPLLDIGSMLFALGVDPLTKFPRLDREQPEHNPLNDARQSARILTEMILPRAGEKGGNTP